MADICSPIGRCFIRLLPVIVVVFADSVAAVIQHNDAHLHAAPLTIYKRAHSRQEARRRSRVPEVDLLA